MPSPARRETALTLTTLGLIALPALAGCARTSNSMSDASATAPDTSPTSDAGPAPSPDAGPLADTSLGPDAPPASDVVTPLPDVVAHDAPPVVPGKLDLLLAIDNSVSMRENQQNIMAQLEPLIARLASPPDANGDGRPDYPPIVDVHVGVVSSDLGTGGHAIIGCSNASGGDEGRLNPIRYGAAMQEHLPWMPARGEMAPPGFRPESCRDANQYPAFITYCSGAAGPDCGGEGSTRALPAFVDNVRCNAGLYVNGCGLEQQLESVWRSLVWFDPSSRPGNTSPHAGFIRDDALLAIVMLTDEEDMSVRDCRFARGEACADATDVFDRNSPAWSSSDLNLRGYTYDPGTARDPTWPLERYVNPRDPSAGWLGAKPGQPDRVFFLAITGVPLAPPTLPDGSVDWDSLLGAPGPRGPEVFYERDSRSAWTTIAPEGPISMRQANADPACAMRVVPACRREGTRYDPSRPACTTGEQYFAWPARRIAEVARRMDQSPLCGGAPCRAGAVHSICAGDFSRAFDPMLAWMQRRSR